jgi:stage II sporulation protein AA (anti-sigma F factor antagonist)
MTSTEPASARSGATIVRLPHEIDLDNAGALRDELLAALNRDGVHLVVDALDVTFMDSSGVNALVRARQRAESLDGSLHVVSSSPAVTRILQITQLDRRLGLVATLDEAFDCVRNPQTIHTCDPGA